MRRLIIQQPPIKDSQMMLDGMDPSNLDKVKGILCVHQTSGGISRMKRHIAQISGDVAPCPKATKEDQGKCKAAIEEGNKKKIDKKKAAIEIREEVAILEEEEEVEVLGSRKRPHTYRPSIPRRRGDNKT
ncbi:hypothetical protein RHMOL_Rhmol10G0080900 [Rhododendron molle]|uniref:Uncharacterized protein n=1 Tax=Rhododendron molle TaxID=49168 RepID=A0ACC0M147_RHOML|nr:hypothetical protein RHMOL_Rhmol10G0080900 [Rhododendron molle]